MISANLVLLALLLINPDAEQRVGDDCGLYCAKAIASRLGSTLNDNEVELLRSDSGFVAIRDVSRALEAAGLVCEPVRLSTSNFDAVRKYILSVGAEGLVLHQPTNHFYVLHALQPNGSLTVLDVKDQTVGRFSLNRNASVPILIVRRKALSRLAQVFHDYRMTMVLAFACFYMSLPPTRVLRWEYLGTYWKASGRFTRIIFASILTAVLLIATVKNWQVFEAVRIVTQVEKPFGFRQKAYVGPPMDVGTAESIELGLQNQTNKEIRIAKFSGSCGCLDILPKDLSISAYGTATLQVRFSNRGREE